MVRHFKDEAQREQFLNMVKMGSSAQQIIDFFKKTYKIILPASTIYSAKNNLKKSGGMQPKADEKPRRHYS